MVDIQKKRKFHDMWAFILYIAFTTIVTGLMAGMMGEAPRGVEEIVLPAVATNVATLLAFMALVFMGFRFIPKQFIFSVFVVIPAILLFSTAFFMSPVYILLSVISLSISIWFYFAFIAPVLPLIAAAAETTAKIISSKFLSFLTILVLSVSAQVIQTSMMIRVLGKEQGSEENILFVLFVLNSYWTTLNIAYFTRVVVSSIVVSHIMSDGNSKFTQALYNGVMALGSISFAGLIISLIATARFLIRREMDRDRNRSGNLFKTILLCIAAVIVTAVGDLVNTMNELAFPYLAFHGTSYSHSVKDSYSLISEKNGLTLLNNIAIEKVISTSMFLFIGFIALADMLLLHINGNIQKDMFLLVSLTIAALPAIMFAYEFLYMFSSGSLALIYTYLESPEAVNKMYPELGEKVREFQH